MAPDLGTAREFAGKIEVAITPASKSMPILVKKNLGRRSRRAG